MAAPQLPAFLRQTKAQLHAKFIDLEWQQRNRLLQGTQQQQASASDASPNKFARLTGEHVAARNRYLNVEPYAANRVKLRGVAEGTSDYINASPIVLGEVGSGKERRYIATQGPKDSSVNHFYRMLLQECSAEDEGGSGSDDAATNRGAPAVVVTLTQTHEAGREKCFQYYPLSASESPLDIPDEDEPTGGGDHFRGEVELESVEANDEARCEVRRMLLRVRTIKTSPSPADAKTGRGVGDEIANSDSREGKVREKEIRHLLSSGWPDFLIPEGADRAALVKLVELSNLLNTPARNPQATTNGATHHVTSRAANPRIIHCSAGVGRSGTFIALDYLPSLLYSGELDRFGADSDPIAETVDLLRQQRMMMVQGEAQFNFLYEVVREMWEVRQVGGRR